MYLVYCSLIFILIAILKNQKFEWGLLALLSVLLWCNKETFDVTGSVLYYNRAVLTFVISLILISRKTMIAYYQSVVLLFMLMAYCALGYDVSINAHYLIYNNYENVIHGLVICQFIGVFPSVWRRDNDRNAGIDFINKYLSRNERA